MLVMLLGIVTLVSPVQPSNALLPMLVTLLGIATLVSPEQSLNAVPPMLVTLFGIVMLVSPEQSLNADCPMLMISSSKVSMPIPFSYILETSIAPKADGSVLVGNIFLPSAVV